MAADDARIIVLNIRLFNETTNLLLTNFYPFNLDAIYAQSILNKICNTNFKTRLIEILKLTIKQTGYPSICGY